MLMNKFKNSIEKKISAINNSINQVDSINELSPLVDKFTRENFVNIDSNDEVILNKYLVGEYSLTVSESKLIKFVTGLDDVLKSFVGTENLMSKEQFDMLDNIRSKIILVRDNYNSDSKSMLLDKLNKYKVLLSKLDNNHINLINEFDIINEVLRDGSYSLSDKVAIYKMINSLNSDIYKNYNINNEVDEDKVLSEDDLVETNLGFEKLKQLFDMFGIDWSKEDYLITDEKKLKIIKDAREVLINKLLKFGDYDKMLKLLSFIKEKDLTFVFDMPEILTKTLLYTTVELLSDFINKVTLEGLDYKFVLKSQPSNFIPPVIEKRKKDSGFGGGSEKNITGSLKNFMKTIDFLKFNGFSVNEIYAQCPILFIRKCETGQKIFNRLNMYGISFRYPNGVVKDAFSVLHTLDVLDRLDVAIECGCYDYVSNNITKLVDPAVNFYRVKCAKSFGINDSDIFRSVNKSNNIVKFMRKEKGAFNYENCGKTSEDTFVKYGAVNTNSYFDEKDVRLFETVLGNSDNDKISEISLNDSLIAQLDSLGYRVPENDLIYNFNGIIISRFKVLRLYQTLISDQSIVPSKDVLLYAIARNSMLTESEMTTLINCLNNIKFKRRDLA